MAQTAESPLPQGQTDDSIRNKRASIGNWRPFLPFARDREQRRAVVEIGRAAARKFLGEAPIVLRQRAQLVGDDRVEARFRKVCATQGVRKQLLFSHDVPLVD